MKKCRGFLKIYWKSNFVRGFHKKNLRTFKIKKKLQNKKILNANFFNFDHS